MKYIHSEAKKKKKKKPNAKRHITQIENYTLVKR